MNQVRQIIHLWNERNPISIFKMTQRKGYGLYFTLAIDLWQYFLLWTTKFYWSNFSWHLRPSLQWTVKHLWLTLNSHWKMWGVLKIEYQRCKLLVRQKEPAKNQDKQRFPLLYGPLFKHSQIAPPTGQGFQIQSCMHTGYTFSSDHRNAKSTTKGYSNLKMEHFRKGHV